MKRSCILLSLIFLLGACQGATENSASSDSFSSNIDENDSSFKERLASLKNGFKGSSLLRSGTKSTGEKENYLDFAITSKGYQFVTYADADIGFAKRDQIVNKSLYTRYIANAVIEELGLDNQIHRTYITDSQGTYFTWDALNLKNPFASLDVDDFVFNKERNCYSLDLSDQSNKKKLIYSALANVFSGQIGYEPSEADFFLDGEKGLQYEIVMKDYSSSYGIVSTSLKGEITETGKDVVELPVKIQGEEDKLWEDAFKKYAGNNYKAEITLSSKKITAEVYSSAIHYDEYDASGNKTGSYGYYQKDDEHVQGLTMIGGTSYVDASPIEGSMVGFLPSFTLSSKFFVKSDESDDTKAVYEFNEAYRDKVANTTTAYSLLRNGGLGKLRVTITSDELLIENDLGDSGVNAYRYYDADEVTDFISGIKTSSDSLTWSELLSNQPEDLKKLYENTISKKALDLLPIPGGSYSYANLSFNSKRNLAMVTFSLEDYQEGETFMENYTKKLVEKGFAQEEKEEGTDILFTKDVTIDGENKKIGIEVKLAASYFQSPKIVCYFTESAK